LPENLDELNHERQVLLLRNHESGLSKPDERRLAYLGWCLDQVIDSELDRSLDRLERLVEEFERGTQCVAEAAAQVEDIRRPNSKHRKRRR
jgi:hypothetical protein